MRERSGSTAACRSQSFEAPARLSEAPQPGTAQRRPPWEQQNSEGRCALLGQPGCLQRAPPPCPQHRAVLPRAARAQPGTSQRRPPWCARQKAVLPWAALRQGGWQGKVHLRPPP